MSILPHATLPAAPKSNDAAKIALVYAVILVVMAVAQLFTFDTFTVVVTEFYFPGGVQYAHFLTALLVTAEVFALPFLLRMSLSPAFRWLSMILGWLVALIWTKLTIWIMLHEIGSNNVGFLGSAISLTPGWWAVFISLTFGIMAAWASWGLWPGKRATKRVVSKRK